MVCLVRAYKLSHKLKYHSPIQLIIHPYTSNYYKSLSKINFIIIVVVSSSSSLSTMQLPLALLSHAVSFAQSSQRRNLLFYFELKTYLSKIRVLCISIIQHCSAMTTIRFLLSDVPGSHWSSLAIFFAILNWSFSLIAASGSICILL